MLLAMQAKILYQQLLYIWVQNQIRIGAIYFHSRQFLSRNCVILKYNPIFQLNYTTMS